jgi:hypothetical protein
MDSDDYDLNLVGLLQIYGKVPASRLFPPSTSNYLESESLSQPQFST